MSRLAEKVQGRLDGFIVNPDVLRCGRPAGAVILETPAGRVNLFEELKALRGVLTTTLQIGAMFGGCPSR